MLIGPKNFNFSEMIMNKMNRIPAITLDVTNFNIEKTHKGQFTKLIKK